MPGLSVCHRHAAAVLPISGFGLSQSVGRRGLLAAVPPTTWKDIRTQLDPLMVEPGDWIYDIDGEYWRIVNVGERRDAWWMAFRFGGDRDAPFDFDDADRWLDTTFDGATMTSVVGKIRRFTRGNRVMFRQRHGSG
jgi:hypothetical protein